MLTLSDQQADIHWRPVIYVGWKAAAKRTWRCLEPIAGRPLICHVVDRLHRGLGRPITVVHHEDAAAARLRAALAASPGVLFTSKAWSMSAALGELAESVGVEQLAIFADTGPIPDCETALRMIRGHLREQADCTIAAEHPTGLLPIVMHVRALPMLAPCEVTRPDWSDPFIRASDLLTAPAGVRAGAWTQKVSRFVEDDLAASRLPARVLVTDRRTREAAAATIAEQADESGASSCSGARAASTFKDHWSHAVRRRLELAPEPRARRSARRRVLLASCRDAFAGGELCFSELIRYLSRSPSYEPVVLVQSESLLAEKARALGVTVEVADFNLIEMGQQSLAFGRDLLAHYDIEIVHLDNHIPAALCPALVLAASECAIPVVAHARLYLPPSVPLSEIAFHYARVIAPSKYIADSLARTLLAADRLVQIYDGLDLGVLNPALYDRASARRGLGIPADAQVLTMVAAINEYKRQDLLVEALSHLRTTHPRAVALLVGEADNVERPALHRLSQQVKRLGLQERVVFAGYQPHVGRVYAASDAVVMCMPEEGWGRATAEAMAMGVPVVVPRAGGARELVSGDSDGLAFEPDNVEDLVRKLRTALDDQPLRQRLATAGRAIASPYTIEAHGRAVEAVYGQVLLDAEGAATVASHLRRRA